MENSEDKLPQYSFRQQKATNPYKPFIYAVILAFGVMLGFLVNSITEGKQPLISRQYNKIDDILNFIQSKYVDTVDRAQLTDQTIDEMLSNLDPHSVYIPARDVSEMNESLEGNFEGIGIEFSIVQDTITVVSAIAGGPSETAGLKAGDRIVKINDSTVAGISIKDTDVKKKLRGPAGSTVKVSVQRSTSAKLLDFNITRDKIPLYSVDAAYFLDPKTGYIKISSFSSTTYEEFMQKVDMLKAEGMEKLVIDLRGNPGGFLQAATSIADELISGDKLLLYTEGKSYARQDYRARKQGIFEQGKLCVLIDQFSASASEILSGAVQDWDRGEIIGRTSFGKGLVQEQYILKDGSALRLTVARYYIPSGRCIQRSYANGKEKYDEEIYERYMRGEFVHEDTVVADTTVYKTASGRIVYGGGGIRPDLFVPIDTTSDNDYYYSVRTYIPEFVYKYSSNHSDFLDKYESPVDFGRRFNVSDELLNEFYAYAKDAGLKKDSVKKTSSEDKIKLTLKAYFAKQEWRLEGFYYVMNQDDNVIKTALQQMQ